MRGADDHIQHLIIKKPGNSVFHNVNINTIFSQEMLIKSRKASLKNQLSAFKMRFKTVALSI